MMWEIMQNNQVLVEKTNFKWSFEDDEDEWVEVLEKNSMIKNTKEWGGMSVPKNLVKLFQRWG